MRRFLYPILVALAFGVVCALASLAPAGPFRHRGAAGDRGGAVMRDAVLEALSRPLETLRDAALLVLLTAALCALGVMAWAAIGGPA